MLCLCRALELGSMVEEVLSEEAEPRHLSQLQTAIDNLQTARSAQSTSHGLCSLSLHMRHVDGSHTYQMTHLKIQ